MLDTIPTQTRPSVGRFADTNPRVKTASISLCELSHQVFTQTEAMPQDNKSNQPAYGSRLLPQVLDDLAASKPKRIYASFPKTFDLKDGFRDVTVSQMSLAVNAMAWWLERKIGKSSTFETVSYLGPPDIRYAIVFLAAVKCGYKVSSLL